MIYAAGFVIFALGVLLWLMRRDNLELGKTKEQNASQEKVMDNVVKANQAVDRLYHDDKYADGVRKRFTRE